MDRLLFIRGAQRLRLRLAEIASCSLSATPGRARARPPTACCAGTSPRSRPRWRGWRRCEPNCSACWRIAGLQVTALAELAKQVAVGQQPGAREAARGWLGDTAAVEPVTRAELHWRMREGGVLVLDVRPPAEYAAGHVAGAVSIPAGELPARLAGLPRDQEIVAYCRGRFCVMSLDAVRLLRRHGYRARPMDGGLPEWRDEGMPIAAA